MSSFRMFQRPDCQVGLHRSLELSRWRVSYRRRGSLRIYRYLSKAVGVGRVPSRPIVSMCVDRCYQKSLDNPIICSSHYVYYVLYAGHLTEDEIWADLISCVCTACFFRSHEYLYRPDHAATPAHPEGHETSRSPRRVPRGPEYEAIRQRTGAPTRLKQIGDHLLSCGSPKLGRETTVSARATFSDRPYGSRRLWRSDPLAAPYPGTWH
jgi:hypothetical protein